MNYADAVVKQTEARERKKKRQEKALTLWPKEQGKIKKRRRKSMFVRLRDELDREAQRYAAERDAKKGCRIRKAQNCTGISEVGYHLLPRGKWAVRWNLDFMGIGNIVGACSACNAGEKWNRLDYREHHRGLFGEHFYDSLWEEAHKPYHYTSLDLEKRIKAIHEMRLALATAL